MSDSRWSGDPKDLIAQVDRQVLQAEERAATAAELVDQIGQVESEVRSDDRMVTVRVDASGRLTHLRFDARATDMPADRLSELVMATLAIAQRRAASEAITLTEAAFGDGLSTRLRGEYETKLGSLDEDPEEPGGRRPY